EDSCRLAAEESEADLAELGVAWSDLVKLQVDRSKLKQLHMDLQSKATIVRKRLDEQDPTSTVSKLVATKGQIANFQTQLDVPTRRYQEYITALKEWKEGIARVESDPEDPDSIEKLRVELKRIS